MSVRRQVPITDEQFKVLFDAYPDDPELIAQACRDELVMFGVPNATGRTQSGVRVFRDDGFMGSGYVLVHRDDVSRLSWSLDNGYTPNGFPLEEMPIKWDEQPERERLLDARDTLRLWAYP